MKKIFKAFTLAETMIVIVVLGIIATLTIPALVNKNKEAVAKTKLRKAMAAYESAINKMIIENDLKSDTALTEWGNITNCTNSTNYFKKSKDINGCIFKTSDGVWWNISDITRPVISFKEITAQNSEQITANANNENDKTAFVLVGRFGTDGSLRVDDLAYETANSIEDANGNQSKAQVEKLYKLLGMKKAGSGSGNTSPFAKCNHADTCAITYNCPTTEEPNKTCTMEYTKVMIEEDYTESYEYCDPEDWNDNNWNCRNWKTSTSTATAGEYYMAIEGYPDDYETQAFNYEGSTCQYCQDNDTGDYYNAAKRHCETSGGRLATVAEIRVIAQDILVDDATYYWTDNKCAPNDGCFAGYYDFGSFEMSDRSTGVLCIGQ